MAAMDLRAALGEIVRQRGGDPENQTERAAVVGLADQGALSRYETGRRPTPERVLLRLENVQLREENAQLRSRVEHLESLLPNEDTR